MSTKGSKRITEYRLMKYVKSIGLVGIPLATLLISYLVLLDVITVINYSDDMKCGGDDICEARITFYAKNDIFIYPMNASWMLGTETVGGSEPAIEWIKMYRTWGSGLREIKLNDTCKGTWCGGRKGYSNNAYSFVFRAGRTYTIVYQAKKTPESTIKWSFNPEGYWLPNGKMKYNYKKEQKPKCKGNVCNLIIREENECLIESDEIHMVECMNWTDSSITIKVNKQNNPRTFENVQVKIHNNGTITDKNPIMLSNTNNEVILTLDYKLGDIIHIGNHSTTIKLQTANNSNLGDTGVFSYGTGSEDQGTCTAIVLSYDNSTRYANIFFKFNISSIPASSTINDARLYMYTLDNRLDAGESIYLYSHNVYNFPTFNISNQEWNEGNTCSGSAGCSGNELCFNTIPTGSEFNATLEDNITITTGQTGWYDLNVTNMVTSEYNNNYDNVSIWIKTGLASGTPGIADNLQIRSKENSNSTTRPYINVTYTVSAQNDTCTCPGVNQNWQVTLNDNCSIESNCNIGTGLLNFTGVGNFYCDAIINTTGLGDPKSGGIIWINDSCILSING